MLRIEIRNSDELFVFLIPIHTTHVYCYTCEYAMCNRQTHTHTHPNACHR